MVGSNCLDERSAIAGVGPITVEPTFQNCGVGRTLMEAVLARAREREIAPRTRQNSVTSRPDPSIEARSVIPSFRAAATTSDFVQAIGDQID
jgi:GNAT superfamily N-acetyltransferase